MWQTIARIILRKKLYLGIALVVITLFLGYEASKVEMDYHYANMLSENDAVYKDNKKFKETFGEEANAIAVGISEPNIFKLENFRKFQKLTRDLKNTEYVNSSLSVCDAINVRQVVKEDEQGNKSRKFETYKLFPETITSQQELDSLKEVFFNLPFYDGLLYNKDKTVFLLTISIDTKILNSPTRQTVVSEIADVIQKYSEDNNVETHISGHPYIRTKMMKMISSELVIFVILAALVCVVILYLFFKSFKIIIAAMIVVALSIIWTIGLMSILDYKLTIFTAMIPPLLIVIGVPNAVFLLNKYYAEYKKHGKKIMALQRAICRVGNASFLTNLTTACGFATFIVTSNRLLVEFGVSSSFGIMSVFLLSLIVIPSFFSICKEPTERAVKHLDNKIVNKVIDKIEFAVTKKRTWVYGFFGTLVVVMLIGIFFIKRTGYILDDIPNDDELYVDTKYLEEHFAGVSPLEIAISTKDTLHGQDFIYQIEKLDSLQQRLAKYPELSRSISIADAVKFLYQSYSRGNVENYRLPEDLRTYETIMNRIDIGSSGLANKFIDSSNTVTRISMNIEDIGTDRMADLMPKIKKDIEEIFPTDKYGSIVTGSSVMYFTGTIYLIKNLFWSLALAILVIAGFMFWMFRSSKMTLLSLVPNVIPMIVTAGMMGFCGIPIKPSTILVFSIAFGISVDDTIHYLAKYRQELKINNWNIGLSARNALHETGISMLYTSVILMFGFIIFTASDFGGTVSLGLLVSMALFVAMFSNIIILPSLLLSLEKHFNKKIFREPCIQIYDEEDEIDLDELKIEENNGDNSI